MARIVTQQHQASTRSFVETNLRTRELGYTDAAGYQELIFKTEAGAFRHFPSLERLDDAAAAATSGSKLVGFFPQNGLASTDVQDAIQEIWDGLSGGVTGSGTTGKIPKFSAATVLANSLLSESGGTVTQAFGTAGSAATLEVTHSDNTNGASHARLRAKVAGGSGGDPFLLFEIDGVSNRYFGVDNSDSDKLIIGTGSAVGTSAWLTFTTSGAAAFSSTLTGSGGVWINSSNSFTSHSAAALVQISRDNEAGFSASGFGASGAALYFRHASGSFASQTATTSGTLIGYVGAYGHDGTSIVSSAKALINIKAINTWSGSDNSTQIILATTPTGSTTRSDIATFQSSSIIFNAPLSVGTTGVPGARLYVIGGSGSSAGLRLQTNETDATNKEARIKSGHYTNSEEPVTMAYVSSTTSASVLSIGGGSSAENAVTTIDFYTAANNTTTNGTRRGGFNSAGELDLVVGLKFGSGTLLSAYVEGTFTATLTGVSGSVTATAYYTKIGNKVTLHIRPMLGTSNATTCTITGMPAEIRPTSFAAQMTVPTVVDNTTAYIGRFSIASSGVITLSFKSSINLDFATAFTSSGLKGTEECVVSYLII